VIISMVSIKDMNYYREVAYLHAENREHDLLSLCLERLDKMMPFYEAEKS